MKALVPRSSSFNLPTASASVLGGVKVGTTLEIDGNGVLDVEASLLGDTMLKSIYDTDEDGIVDAAERISLEVTNRTGAQIDKGSVVYLSGAQGNRPKILLAKADAEATSSLTIGVVETNIEHGANGYVTLYGKLHNVDTSAFFDGDLLYLSASVAGGYTTVKPVAPNHSVVIATVAYSHAQNGVLAVHVENGHEITELHDVLISAVADRDTLVYDSGTGLWVNETVVEQTEVDGKIPSTGISTSNGAYTSTLTYNEATREITIAPTGASFIVYVQGVKYTKTAQTLAHTDTQGGHFFYYDATGTLTYSTSPWDLLLHAPVAYVFWDAANNKGIAFEERHQAGRDVYWHRNQHSAEGTKTTGTGFGISGYTLNDGSTDGVLSYAIASGRVEDEDIRIDTGSLADGGPYTLLYRNGVGGDWVIDRSFTLPFLASGGVLQYNLNTAGTWSRASVTEDYYVNYYVFVLTALSTADQFIIVPGQAIHSSEALATAESVASLSWGTVPFQEIAPLYKVTLRYNAVNPGAYTNTNKCAIIALSRIIGTNATISQAAQVDHGSLSGLSDLDHPASAIIFTPVGTISATNVQDAIAEVAAEATGSDVNSTNTITITNKTLLALTNNVEARSGPDASSFGFRNKIIGGDFTTNPWQRGTSFTAPASGAYTADRWRLSNSISAVVVDVLKTADAPTASEAGVYTGHCLHIDVTIADASLATTEFFVVQHIIEGLNSASFGFGETGTRYVTLSFWHKHTKTGTYCVSFYNSNILGTRKSYIAEYTQDVTDTWEQAVITIPVDTSGAANWLKDTGIGLGLSFVVGGAIGGTYENTAETWHTGIYIYTANQVNALDSTANNFKLALIQLEAGQTATPFECRPYGVELALCQRYAQQNTAAVGYSVSTTSCQFALSGFAAMRTTPTATLLNGTSKVLDFNAGNRDLSSITGSASFSTDGIVITATVTTTTASKVHALEPNCVLLTAEL